nr:helix-turn-helix domain-containing protein [uncultured Roseococcus sp.]
MDTNVWGPEGRPDFNASTTGRNNKKPGAGLPGRAHHKLDADAYHRPIQVSPSTTTRASAPLVRWWHAGLQIHPLPDYRRRLHVHALRLIVLLHPNCHDSNLENITLQQIGGRDMDASSALSGATRPSDTMLLPSIVTTTSDVPAREQFDAWRDSMGTYVEALPASNSHLGFDARSAAWHLGSFLLNHAVLPACSLRRTPQQVRRDALDHWVIAICKRGQQQQRAGDAVTDMVPGVPYVFSAAHSFEATRSGSSMDWIGLYFPRDAVPKLNGALDTLTSGPLTGPVAVIFSELLVRLVEQLPATSIEEAAHLAGALEALLGGICAGVTRTDLDAFRGVVDAAEFGRIRRIIRENLGSAKLNPVTLSRRAGMSRTALYRLFEAEDGVAAYIRRERLRLIYRQLTDPQDRRSISAVAEGMGFFDPSAFSRAFRQEFGSTPSDVREAARLGTPAAPLAAHHLAFGQATSLTAMLRLL